MIDLEIEEQQVSVEIGSSVSVVCPRMDNERPGEFRLGGQGLLRPRIEEGGPSRPNVLDVNLLIQMMAQSLGML